MMSHPTTTHHPATTRHPAATSHPTTTQHPAAMSHPTTTQNPAMTSHPAMTSYPAMTSHPATTHHPATSHDTPLEAQPNDPQWIKEALDRRQNPSPVIDPVDPRTREHNRYKISQENHAMARRRVMHGDQVDAGYYGMVNPDPPTFNNDPDELKLQNLKEARYHATNEINGRQAFNDNYYGGEHQGINEQVEMRKEHVDQYNRDIARLENHINNPRTDLDNFSGDSDHNATLHIEEDEHASQPHTGWWDEEAHDYTGHGHIPQDGNHEQDHDNSVIGWGVQHPGHPNLGDEDDYDEQDEEDGFDLHEHDNADAEDAEKAGSFDDTYQGRNHPNPFSQAAYAQWKNQGVH